MGNGYRKAQERKNQRIKDAIAFREQTAALEMLLDAKWNGAYFVKRLEGPIHGYTYYDRAGNRMDNVKVDHVPPTHGPDVRLLRGRGKSQFKMVNF